MAAPQPESFSPNNADLCTVGDVRAYINSQNTQQTFDDNTIQRLITAFSQSIDSYTSRHLMAQGYTETRNGRNEIAMTVKYPSIIAVQSVAIDGYTINQSTSLTVAGWVNDERMIYLRAGTPISFGPTVFCNGIMNVVLSYWSGYETPGQVENSVTFPAGIIPPALPLDIQEVCIEMVMLANRQRPRLGDQSTGVGPEKLTYYLRSMSERSRETIGRYSNNAFPLT